MEYTEQQKVEFKAAFALRRRNQTLVSVPFFVVLVVLAFTRGSDAVGRLTNTTAILYGLLFAGVIGVLVFSFRNWRCPACNRYLGRTFNPRHCVGCGAQLHD